MKVLAGPWREWPALAEPTSVTIGVLDGVHLGHRSLLSGLDPSLDRTVLTFDPHPIEVLKPGFSPRLLTTIEERIELLAGLEIDVVGILDLSEIREQSPEAFVQEVLVAKLDTKHLVVGEDFRFGRDRAGDVDMLRQSADASGFSLSAIELISDGDGAVSSSRIRHLVEEGRVEDAAGLLGSHYRVTNRVVDGDKRGREIGFPTANLQPPDRKVLPGMGVYACRARIGGEVWDAAVNVGVRPTFGGTELVVEAFLLDFDDDIYGEMLTLEFVERLRPELEFQDVQDLIDQMGRDVARTREILGMAPPQM